MSVAEKMQIGVNQALRERRSIKGFDPEHRMSEAEFSHLMEHALLSPTAFNLQHWRFVRVRDSGLRSAIRQVAWDQAQITDASELLILCWDMRAWEKDPQRYWRHAPQEVRDMLLPAIDRYYRDNPQAQRDEGLRSCAIAAMAIMLLAKEMGYDSCPMDGFDFEQVGRLINLPADHAIALMIAIGKKTREPWPRSGQLALDEVLHTDRF